MESTLTISKRRCINTKTAKRHHYQFTSHRTMSKQIDDIPLARRRVIATELLLKGESISEVSRKARLSLPTVSKYKDLIERGGPEALARLRIHGNIPRLDDASQSWLVSAIKHSPGLHGYPGQMLATLSGAMASHTVSLIQLQKIRRV
jgi:transposase